MIKGHVKGCQYARWELIKAPCACYERRLRVRVPQRAMRLSPVAVGVRRALIGA